MANAEAWSLVFALSVVGSPKPTLPVNCAHTHIHVYTHTHTQSLVLLPQLPAAIHIPLVDVLPPFPASSSGAPRDFVPSLGVGGSPSQELHLRASCLHVSQEAHRQLADVFPGAGQAGFMPGLLLQMGSRSTQCLSQEATGQWVEMSSMGYSFRGHKPYFFLHFTTLALIICSTKTKR